MFVEKNNHQIKRCDQSGIYALFPKHSWYSCEHTCCGASGSCVEGGSDRSIKSIRLRLPSSPKTSLPMSASAVANSEWRLRRPHDPCWPAQERDRESGTMLCGTSRSRVQGCQKRQKSGLSATLRCLSICHSVYPILCACVLDINNGWAEWRQRCQHRKKRSIRNSESEDSISQPKIQL